MWHTYEMSSLERTITLGHTSMASWKIPVLCRKYIFKWSISHCYVSLPECNLWVDPLIGFSAMFVQSNLIFSLKKSWLCRQNDLQKTSNNKASFTNSSPSQGLQITVNRAEKKSPELIFMTVRSRSCNDCEALAYVPPPVEGRKRTCLLHNRILY